MEKNSTKIKQNDIENRIFTILGVQVMIDETELYHIGASLKDMGKKWFAFSKMDTQALEMFNLLKIKNQ